MKTVPILVLTLVSPAVVAVFAFSRFAFDGGFAAAAMAALLVVASRDRTPRPRYLPSEREAEVGRLPLAAGAGPKICVLCAGVAS